MQDQRDSLFRNVPAPHPDERVGKGVFEYASVAVSRFLAEDVAVIVSLCRQGLCSSFIGTDPVVSRNSITTELTDNQCVRMPRRGRFLIVFRVFGRSDSANERDDADGGGFGGLDEPAAEEGEVNCRDRLGGLLRYYYRDAA